MFDTKHHTSILAYLSTLARSVDELGISHDWSVPPELHGPSNLNRSSSQIDFYRIFPIMLDQLHGPLGMLALGAVCSLIENLVRQHSLTHALRVENMNLLAALQYTNDCYDKLRIELDEQSVPGTPQSVRKPSSQRGTLGPTPTQTAENQMEQSPVPPLPPKWADRTTEAEDPFLSICKEANAFKLLYEAKKQLLRTIYGDQWLTCCVVDGDLVVKSFGQDQTVLINEGLMMRGGFYFEVRNPTVDETFADVPTSCGSDLFELTCSNEVAVGGDPRATIAISLTADPTIYTCKAVVDTGSRPHCVLPLSTWNAFKEDHKKTITKIMVNNELAFLFSSSVYIKSDENHLVAVNGGKNYHIHTLTYNKSCCVIGFDIIRDLNLHVLSDGTYFGKCRTCNNNEVVNEEEEAEA